MKKLDKRNKNEIVTNRNIILSDDIPRENKETISHIFIECLKKSCSETTAHAIPNIGK